MNNRYGEPELVQDLEEMDLLGDEPSEAEVQTVMSQVARVGVSVFSELRFLDPKYREAAIEEARRHLAEYDAANTALRAVPESIRHLFLADNKLDPRR